ncbi:MAG: PAS domain-containing protein, partial [Gammaproteobacteria bacterium]|nr:PAS domain-containing protein [Gammaproteobacteria bacterium]
MPLDADGSQPLRTPRAHAQSHLPPFLIDRDWTRSKLGHPDGWPLALRNAATLVSDSAVAMWLGWGPELSMVYNESYSRILASKHPAAMGAKFADVWSEISDDITPLVAAALSGQALYREDYQLTVRRGPTDEHAWFTFSFSPLRDDDGKVAGLICTVWETTEKVLAQRRMAESEARLKALMLAVSKVVYRTSADWSHVLDMHGQGFLADSPAADANWTNTYVHADDRQRMADTIRQAIEEQRRFEIEHRVIRLDGSSGWALTRAIPIFDGESDADGQGSGRLVEWLGTSMDLSERKSAELALEESERQFRALFEAIDEGFCVIRFLDGPHGPLSDYVHVMANPAYAANAGIENVVGQRVRDMVPLEADGWVEIYRKVLLTGEPVRFERELEHTSRYLELAAFRIDPPERREVAVLFQDVTPRRRAEVALRELNDSLELRVAEEVAQRLKTEEALR